MRVIVCTENGHPVYYLEMPLHPYTVETWLHANCVDLSPNFILSVTKEIVLVVSHLHKQGLVHLVCVCVYVRICVMCVCVCECAYSSFVHSRAYIHANTLTLHITTGLEANKRVDKCQRLSSADGFRDQQNCAE